MDSQIENLEEKLKSLLGQLQANCGIFERLVYKNKNQHRRSSYFQYLLKVRRDLRLLQSAKLEELLGSCFQVITGKKPKQKMHLLESLKRRKGDGGKRNFMERLLGAARLLTQILLDVVSVFNTMSSLSQKKRSVKINQGGIEVAWENDPVNDKYIALECAWNTDRFVLLETSHKSIKSFLGDDTIDYGKVDAENAAGGGPININEDKIALLASPSIRRDDVNQVDSSLKVREIPGTLAVPGQMFTPVGGSFATSRYSPNSF